MLASSLTGFLSLGTTLPTALLGASVTVIGGSSKSDAVPWALVLFCVILGVIVSLNPSRRTTEIKHSKED
jgi:hypothetical protein